MSIRLTLAAALASCLTAAAGFAYGVHVGAAQEQAAQKRADDAREAERTRLQAQIDASAQRHQAAEYARQGAVREIYHESQKVIERPVYRNVCLDADGVGLLDRAAATANGEPVAGPAGAAAASADGPAKPQR
ncbi:hypothetical protein [Sphingobium yanoikuyae]|uniref:Uncharacterized protein n=1 Tax=Sphingobium yanoikuyae TaxID=13690 RepID=A0A291MWJ3_SPHYA|nr:hypothetical protein [Sphingobium yanoikuyae]ATI79457.1 hypothetical protein A6768_05085 [Sphingobium yanoikuyae]